MLKQKASDDENFDWEMLGQEEMNDLYRECKELLDQNKEKECNE